jgi:hypothetical protein
VVLVLSMRLPARESEDIVHKLYQPDDAVIQYFLQAKGYKSGRNSLEQARAALRALVHACMQPGTSTVLHKYRSRLDAGLILKLGLESQEGNRSPGFYSRIALYSIITSIIVAWIHE